MNKPSTCNLDSEITPAANTSVMGPVPRRSFFKGAGLAAAGLTCTDFLSHFLNSGLPNDARAGELAEGADKAADNPNFLVYWFIEGGWSGYDMFNPVMTDNNVLKRLDRISDERYRVLKWGEENYGIKVHGNIRHGFLANDGRDLFKDMAVLSSMKTSGTGHSSERLRAHMGTYRFRNTDERQEDERSVMQAFAEVYGQPYLLPNLSWHWWLSDGELNEVQYSGRRGYYHALGPRHAHTIYAGTPARMKKFLLRTQEHSGSEIGRTIESFLDNAHREFLDDKNIHAVKSYHAARSIYLELQQRGYRLDRATLLKLFSDPALREEFKVKPVDELITYRSVNGNKARSKFAPNTNVQAMMTYELMRAGLTCGFFIESRDVRRFDSHFTRARLWNKEKKPIGFPDQTQMMRENLWAPLHAFVDRLRNTEYRKTGSSLYDHTNIVLTSEFGRSIHGNVDGILKKQIDEMKKAAEIGGQDISAHWSVTSCAFLGSKVKGDSQFGGVGEKTLMPIPLLPDGSFDPNYDPVTGQLRKDKRKHPKSSIPNHGDVNSTALHLCGIDPKGRGRNERGPLTFIKRSG